MPLDFPGPWRFSPPADGRFVNATIPWPAISEFSSLIGKIGTQAGKWFTFEHFKSVFSSRGHSSSESWAESDMNDAMHEASSNAPLFIESFYDGCKSLDEKGYAVPGVDIINQLLTMHNIGYQLAPPLLIARESQKKIHVTAEMPTKEEQANRVLRESMARSDELLNGGHGREAVQELLWLLESVTTAFRGLETESGKVEGKYFNEIIRKLRIIHKNQTLDRVLEWLTSLHGFLSSPSGGGVRHGVDIRADLKMTESEARLFCNLINSYLDFLLSEYERIQASKACL